MNHAQLGTSAFFLPLCPVTTLLTLANPQMLLWTWLPLGASALNGFCKLHPYGVFSNGDPEDRGPALYNAVCVNHRQTQ